MDIHLTFVRGGYNTTILRKIDSCLSLTPTGRRAGQSEPPKLPMYSLCISPNHRRPTLVHNMCTGVGHEDVAAVDAAEAEARKREGGSYLSAVLTAILSAIAQSAAVALAEAEASAESEALA